MTAKTRIALFSAFILIAAGCSFERNLKLDARLPFSPAIRQIPLRIGVYYSQEFSDYTRRIELIGCGPSGRRDKSGIFFIFPVGASSRDLFGQIAASMFTTVTTTSVASLSGNSGTPMDGLLEPRIESFEWGTECTKDYLSSGRLTARVSYIINLYDSPDGRLVTSMHVTGQATEKPRLCFKDCKDSIAAEKAIQNAMAVFMTDFQQQPEVRRWLSTHSAAPGNNNP